MPDPVTILMMNTLDFSLMARAARAAAAVLVLGFFYVAGNAQGAGKTQPKKASSSTTAQTASAQATTAQSSDTDVPVPELAPAFLQPSAAEQQKSLSDLAGAQKSTVTGLGYGTGPQQARIFAELPHSPLCKNEENDVCYSLGPGVSPPRALFTPQPDFPASARKARYQGMEKLRVIVGADGHVYNLKVLKSLSADFDQESMAAVKQWKFRPAAKDGKPVAVAMDIEIEFHLGPSSQIPLPRRP